MCQKYLTWVIPGLFDDILFLLGCLSLDLLEAVEGFGEVILEGVELEPPLALLWSGGRSPLSPHRPVQVLQILGWIFRQLTGVVLDLVSASKRLMEWIKFERWMLFVEKCQPPGWWSQETIKCDFVNSGKGCLTQLSSLWWIPNVVSKGFDTAMETVSSWRFKRYPTTYRWVSSHLPCTVD